MLIPRLLLPTFISISVVATLLAGCTEEQQNEFNRLSITFFEGDYKVTFANGSHVKSWIVRDSKITSEPQKGYYYFWIRDEKGKKKYVQTPIAMTYLEEI